jgi:hypothetical protein
MAKNFWKGKWLGKCFFVLPAANAFEKWFQL